MNMFIIKRAQIALTIILFLLLVVALLIGGYFLYLNLPGEPQTLKTILSKPQLEIGNLSYEVKQFYPNMKFNHNHISYNIESECGEIKKENMIRAFEDLQTHVSEINFYPSSDNPDILVSCSENEKNSVQKNYFVAGEGGAKEIIQTGRYNIITQGVILLYGDKNSINCDWPNVELHELLHVFGFDHSSDKKSLMYPFLESCSQKLDSSIIENLKELYTQENLPDLYFENVTAIKKGRYLDFNITVKNSGSIDAGGAILRVFDGEDKISDFDLKDEGGKVSFGAGISFSIQNLKLNYRSSNDIRLVIDPDNEIREVDEGNNVATLTF